MLAKPKPSAFFGTQLAAILTALRTDTLVVTGMTTSGCVRATVNDAFMLNHHVVIPLECTADRSQLSDEVELFDMGAKYADVVGVEDLIVELRHTARQVLARHPQESREPRPPSRGPSG